MRDAYSRRRPLLTNKKNRTIMIPEMMFGSALSVGANVVNNAMARENAREQRDWQENMWHQQNAYNSPSAMAARMRDAGLNPYSMTGAQPAGSVGTGATAQTIPMENPLNGAIAMAQLRGINAETDKTTNEAARILEQINLDKLAYEQGLLTKDEYELRLAKLREAYEQYNPFTLDAQKTQSEIDVNESQKDKNVADTDLSESERLLKLAQTDYTKALTETENDLRDAKEALFTAQTADARASAERNLKEAAAVKFRVMFERNEDMRRSLQERRAQGLYKFEKAVAEYASELGASDAELAKIRNGVAGIWYDEDRPDIFNAVTDFVHSNVRLGGSAVYSKSNSISNNFNHY